MPAGLIHSYPFPPDRFDEMLVDRGMPRPHCEAFVRRLENLSHNALEQRADFVAEAIESDGVTYNVYADPKGISRPWELDMLPLIISAGDWKHLSAAVAQRARLLDAVLADLYGPQKLIAEGLLPPALVYGQRGYKWPCHGTVPPGGRFLHLYAVDLARSPDGNWWVIADRTQGPSGAGYALQNRIVVSQAFPDTFRNLHIHKLAGFFRSLQEGLARMAPTGGDTPLCVLLTPGPYNETYFEHAFLARYLGFPLVEGQDLTVRDDTVYLKTLRGLRRVHAILRRLDDDFCDPLELRADSALGVPGLLGAVRAGRVLMANALGSGVLESAALFGFLPRISERLLGEPLAMPSVASWWCGEGPALEHVLEHLDELVIKPAFPSMRMETLFGHFLSADERTQIVESIKAQPHAYVAQEWVRLSQAPVWTPNARQRLAPRSVGLRLFAAATPDGYVVMPGALTRVAPGGGVEVISMQRGGMSKDTWVQADMPVRRASLIKKRLGVIDLLCTGTDIPSRVGENLFWMGRHSERSESSARILRAALTRLVGGGDDIDKELSGLLLAASRIGAITSDDDAAGDDPEVTLEQRLLGAVSDLDQPGSIASNLRALALNANHVRERLSPDNWHVLNRLEAAVRPSPTTLDQALGALDQVLLSCVSLAGFAMDGMTRDEGWHFLILGRRIERLAGLSALVSVVLQARERDREPMLEWLLAAANSIVTYRARYRRSPELLPVMHLVVFDTSNPHSVGFQVHSLKRYLVSIAQDLGHPMPPQIAGLEQCLARFDLTAFEAEHCEAACSRLATLLSDAESTAYALSDEIHHRFFIHTARQSRLRSVA
ncbi:MAG TPA: circularly permuted type 2 ATP-grasp protein [Rhodocyclaceae bacterium]|nr:circularly permuted type 2 ATP-grasp protein [Rhodocyclaceae bacterium]HRQ47342.1 circularly permuted type 2 ATP-grasp protein [Rhodocyclaceae bacterium]